ncbi:N-acyl-D-amino-acid deacylase family protein [Sphingomonas sp. URHD0057]|uniref:N-acyl-D-amino-acid deacylase family protein n=1 Tax=Sphingomonas sp. URHD0057 TaxID=1380389 RepID=UPI00056A5D8D|nr:D-aminoacylase [Sphingomonas sp. URHD0057]
MQKAAAVALVPFVVALTSAAPASRAAGSDYSVLIRGGTIYDGGGQPAFVGDVAVKGDKIVYVGPHAPGRAAHILNASGKAVSPGFINMLSWANEDLIADGRGMSETLQGVTLEVMGEGDSMGPWNPAMKRLAVTRQTDIKYPIRWTTLGQYLEYLEHKGVTPNVASFVGATTVREHELGEKDVDPTPEQLRRMRALVRQAMKEGALGVGSSLIYAPASFAETPELTALASETAKCGGMYISHIRDEGNKLLEAIDELVQISRKSVAPAEIYHFKQAGTKNWGKLDAAIARVDQARAAGLRITADMYTYPASATGLDAAFPLWMQDGGVEAWIKRLKDPALRQRAFAEMHRPDADDTAELVTSDPEKVLLIGFKTDKLKPLTGKTLGEVARQRGEKPEEVAADLIVEDGTRIEVVYFEMSEANVRREVGLPWMSFGSDGESRAPEGVFLKSSTHPRSYGNFVRLLGKYVRDEKAVALPDAIRRLTALPATNLALKQRGWLKPGYHADVVVFDPAKVQDHATFVEPQRLATGVGDVFVNGIQVVKNGKHTGAKPGRFVRGPGWTGWPNGGACR